jgi:hypothetical protein
MKTKRYCIIYRMGGTENFTWNRAFDIHLSRERAEAAAEVVRRMGYHTLVEDYDRSLAVGMPETYDAQTEVKG